MNFTRRELLRASSYGIAGTMLASCATLKSCQEAIANRPIRRDINSLAPNDPIIEAYKSAVTQMKALPASDKRSWQNQALIHQNFCPHGNWLFLPWHRVYLLYFERICRKLSGMQDFALPYWNWTANPQVPAVFWGDASNPLFHSPRSATSSSVASQSFIGTTVMDDILTEPNFLLFASGSISATDNQRTNSAYGALEQTPHNNIHGFVGGTMGTYMSPLDPIFWLHHNMIERCWVDWNLIRGNPNTNDSAWTQRRFTEFVDEDGNPVETTVAVSLLFPIFSYQFDTWAQPSGGGAGFAERQRKLSSTSQADREEMERTARTGAPVSIDIVKRFPVQQRLAVELEQPATIPLPVEEGALRGVIERNGQRSLLVFDGVSLDHTGDFYVHVFINKPDATARTPISDPHFVRSFGFFGHAHDNHTPVGSYVLDATETIQRLGLQGGSVNVNLVLVPFERRELKSRTLSLAATELRLIRDVGIQPAR